jgi:hypothetical protein
VNSRVFNLTQLVFLVLGVPGTYLLWLYRFGGNHAATLLVLAAPVITAYVVAGVGGNYYKLWETAATVRWGRFSPHHGLVLGGFGALLVYICNDPAPAHHLDGYELLRNAVVCGSVVGFWNWIYDIHCIRAGFLTVYNRRFAEGAGAEAIATNYSPLHFGLVGAACGVQVRLVEHLLVLQGRTDLTFWLFVGGTLATMLLPSSVYVFVNYVQHGDSGLWPQRKPAAQAAGRDAP